MSASRRSVMVRLSRPSSRAWIVALALVAGCSHTDPFGTDPPDPLGPADPGLPRQLTFTLGDDRSPTVTGTTVAFNRLDRQEAPGECVLLLPAAGGTVTDMLCPPPPTPSDTFISSWLEPALAPDGRRIAFVWRRHTRVMAFAAWSHHLVVANIDSPRVPLVSHRLEGMLPGERLVNTATEIVWTGPGQLRFLAALESIPRVTGSGTGRTTDTTLVRRALMELDATTGTVAAVPGGDSVRAWAPGPDVTYIVPEGVPGTVYTLATDGTRAPVGQFSLPVTDLAWVGGMVVAAVADDSLLWLLPGGESGRIPLQGRAWRLAGAGTNRAIAEVERRGGDAYGAPANLWLVRVPAFSGR